MAEKEYKVGIGFEFHYDGADTINKLEQSIQGIAKALNQVSNNRGFEKYWKSQKELILDVEHSYDRYIKDVNDSSKRNDLIKSVNALKAVTGGDIFEGMSQSVQNAYDKVSSLSKIAVDVSEAYSPASFKKAFESFETLQAAGLKTHEVLRVLGSGADVSQLTGRLQEAENETAELKTQIIDLQNALSNSESGKTIQALKSQIVDLQSQIEDMTYQARREFDQFLDFANINPSNGLESLDGYWNDSSEIDRFKGRVYELYDEIENGSMTAKQAVAAIKAEFAHLMDSENGASLTDFFNSPQLQSFLEKFENVCNQIEMLTKQIGENFASMFTEALNNPELSRAMSEGFHQATNAGGINNVTELANALTSKLGEVDGQTSNIIGDFKEILTIIDSISKTDLTNLDYMTATFESLKSIGDFNVDSKSLEQLRMALDAISQISNVQNLSYLKNLSLDGFKDLKISKASMTNLSEHLSILAKLDIDKLQGLSNINLKNFNDLHISKSSMEALSGFIDKIKEIVQYSNELNNIAQILQSSASKVNQLQNVVSGASGGNGATASANNLAQQVQQLTSSRELLDQAAREVIDNVSADRIGDVKIKAYNSVDEFNNQNEATRLELEKVIDTIQQAKGEIDKISFTTNTVWSGEDVLDDKGQNVGRIVTGTEELTGAIITYRNELGQTIQTQYKWQNALIATGEVDDDGNAIKESTRIFAQGQSRVSDKNSSNADIKKLANDKKKYISQFTSQLNDYLSQALDSAINKPLSDASQNIIVDEIDKIEKSVKDLNNADASNFLEQTLKIKGNISSLSNHIRELRNADNGTSKEDMFDKHESSFRILKQDIKDAGVESEKLTRLLTDIQSVIDKGVDNTTSDDIQRIGKEISNARTELGALKKEAKPEELIAKKTKPFTDLRDINPLNASLYNQEYGSASQKIDELNQKLRSGTITQKSYGEQVDEIIKKLQLMATTVEDVGKNLDDTEVEMKANNFVEQNYSGKSLTPEISTKGNKTTFTYNWEDEQKQAHKLTLEYDKMAGSLRQISHAQKEVKQGATVWEKIKNSFKHLGKYLLTFGSFYEIVAQIRQGVTYVKELDDALTEMRKVSDETVESLKRFQKESFNTADSIGATAKAIQDSTADFMRLGYSLNEASRLAKDANIYANVGDMEIDEATEHMISSIKAWESEFSSEVEASAAIVDRYNEIGNNFAISSADIGAAMERSASALKAGGNTLNESLGLITAGNIIQQDAETTAAALKILSLRIRGSKAELEEMGESTDGLASSTSKLREQIKGLTGVDIMLDENTYKSTAQIIQELGEVYNQLSDIQQASLLELIAGKNRASTVEGLLQNYETIEEVIKSAENAEGSAARENEKYLDSMQGKINQLTNHVQEFWNTFLESENLKNLIDILDILVQKATQFVDSWTFVPTILGSIITAVSLKGKSGGRVRMFTLITNNMPPNRLAERCASPGVY